VLITMAERETKKDGKPEQLAPLLKAKMSALARASEATYIESNIPTNLLPEAGVEHVDVQRLVNAILAPYVLQVRIDGPETVTPRQNVTTLTLFLHELATNSAKYGALGRDTGLIAVSWYDDAQQLKLTWVETGGPPVLSKPDSVGFGSAMIDRLISLAGGSIERIWSPEGLIAQLELPNGTGVEGD
jgi:two-component sensor histidine kinase